MKYVYGQIISMVLGTTLLLTGCEDPGVSVGTLGKKLAAPELKGTSPFDQDFDNQNYARIQGSCDTRVGDLSLSFDNINFQTPPISPDITGTTLSGITNDINCSDGKFDIYLTKNDLNNHWGITTGTTGGSDVRNIYLKGETLIGETKTLNIAKSGGSNSGTATNINVEKVWPAGYMGIDRCEMFKVYLSDANGNETSSSAATAFTLSSDSGTSGATFNSVGVYTNIFDCSNLSGAVQNFSIPAGSSNVFLYYRIPAGSAADATYKFKVTNTSLSSNITSVILRDPSSSRRWVSWSDSTEKIYKDTCYPFSLQRMSYGQYATSEPNAVTLNLISSNSSLKFYSGSECAAGAEMTSVTFPGYVEKASAYVKYVPKAGMAASYDTATISYTTADTNYDITPIKLRIDTSSANTVARLDFWGPNNSTRDNCSAYTIVTANSNWTPIASSTAMTVSLTTTVSGLGFYTDETCSNAISPASGVSSVAIPAGAVSTKVYAKTANLGSGTITLTGTGLNSVSRDLTVKPVMSGANLILNSGASTLTKDTCTLVYLKYMDDYGSIFPMSTAQTYTWTDGNASSSIHVYSDSNCTSSVPRGTAFSPFNNSYYYTFYIKADSSYAYSNLYLTLTGGPLNGVSTTWNVQ
ncbi:MAG: hypothetical protein ACKOX6_00610 [Bdellovibrio sp.]